MAPASTSYFFAVGNGVQDPELKGKQLLVLLGLGWVEKGCSLSAALL